MYFKNVKEGQEVFGLVFGHGVVRNVWDGFYTFEIEYDNGSIVPYTPEGYPAWSNTLDFQTVFFKEDIDLTDIDFSTSEGELSPKKIIKLRAKGKLEIKCPSGVWQPVTKCPGYVTQEYLENNKLQLFRKAK